MTLQELGAETGKPWNVLKHAADALGFGRGWTVKYTPDECEQIRTFVVADQERREALALEKERVAQHKAEVRKQRELARQKRAEWNAQSEARRMRRADREPLAIFSAQVAVSVVPKIRTLAFSLSTPERRVTQGDVISMALDALARELAQGNPRANMTE